MEIDVIISANDIKEEKVKGKTVIIIDILRATSVIVTAINNGCNEVIPVLEVEDALKIVKDNRNKYILGGERNALKIKGFDFSNSPLDYIKDVVANKTLVMTTTNGTRAIHGAISAKNILIGAMLNAKAVAKKVIELSNDLVIINSGTNGHFSIDDFICSGYIIDCILSTIHAELSDIAITSHYIYKENKDVNSFVSNAKHYKILSELGLKDDIKYCFSKDIIDIVPEFHYPKITK
ncbi:2-phosphosulfolactate phosphatase family protein [Clostridium botulinum]|uniref:Probable 2-phosphosulfolactate phosphatase n=1 Tax=Clostridium botulinum C/D str. DC5 TaxID=1443128 RepID=A0A0A0IG16_CLOBO|nr:2-phosphosulfolactate phosphatase family protein [Clostridium botulinum]KEI02398.1 2-phosphosulfolactate phosphatase [Clostridium botulinum C/D str. BKT75002]KEI08272.1 2-phosphosulfolactate phosphatase [Clostridium botulinum C/D str. BKT2873]KGM93648.1 2-phosphosulfolactate phosphatase [Clostridium botulinum D str. CCUG 7971]KGM98520.1 2-phosphosulfolactate phosphatase [Clostridium botulinum C/D str. DC5]KOC47831.1 2-phosphosulfolactate phosphatase [Clostridium botulinum]